MDYTEKIKKNFFALGQRRAARVPEDFPNHDMYLYATANNKPRYVFDYPSVNQFLVQIKNGATIEEKEVCDRWFGGDFLVKLNLVKKHKNMILQNCYSPVKGVVDLDPFIIWLKQLPEVINIYNED